MASFQNFFPATMHSREFEIIHKQMYSIINIRRINENSLNYFKYSLSFELWEDIFAEKEVNITFNSF